MIAGIVYSANQYGSFYSQSTKSVRWQGTSEMIAEHYTITVYPAYLDVELDAEFDCKGAEPDSFRDSLEIRGSLKLPYSSAVTGVLLWNGDALLKGKLKPVPVAREQYNKVVGRRYDPVIIERDWMPGFYNFSIFPVTWGNSRRLRLRYIIPAVNSNGHAAMLFPDAMGKTTATYRIVGGQGITSVGLEKNNGTDTVSLPIEFETGSAMYKNTLAIRLVHEELESATVMYTAQLNTSRLSGTLTQVIGHSGPEIIRLAGLREQFVFLWRWHHPDYLYIFKNQIVRQAEVLKLFFERLTDAKKTAGLILDVEGEEKRVFAPGAHGSASFNKILALLDSLSKIDYYESTDSFPVPYSTEQLDSIAQVSSLQFQEAIDLAESLFTDTAETTIRRIVLMTSGPRWVKSQVPSFRIKVDSTVLLTTLQLLSGFSPEMSDTRFPNEATGFYWPGIYDEIFRINDSRMKIEAVLSLQTGTATKQLVPLHQYQYGIENLDQKLLYTQKLLPEVLWNITMNGRIIRTYSENAVTVPITDALQFGCALAGTENLTTIDIEPPVSYAPVFGFVDRYYSLLALEEDALAPDDMEQYRIGGVPRLGTDDITETSDDSLERYHIEDPPIGNKGEAVREPAREGNPVITFAHQTLTVSFSAAHSRSETVEISVFTLSGRLLYTKRDPIVNRCVHLHLPEALVRSQQVLIVRVNIGRQFFTRTIPIRN